MYIDYILQKYQKWIFVMTKLLLVKIFKITKKGIGPPPLAIYELPIWGPF